MTTKPAARHVIGLSAFCAIVVAVLSASGTAQTGPALIDPSLSVRTVVSGLVTPTSMAFIGPNDLLVLERSTGQVKRVVNGAVTGTVLDLAVNFGSERGLLGLALHPQFPTNPGVYLYWTESTTGADTNVLGNTTLLGNRVDRFVWNGSTLTLDSNVTRIRALQTDASQPERGNHNGGVITFGEDGKLYVFTGDTGRRGNLQNLPCGPTATCPGPTVPDDQYGGPAPDNAHRTGVILRLNDDGTTPADNPFFAAGAAMGGEAGANVQRIFSYGHRNGFGLAVDPRSGNLWLEENGDDSFSELNRVEPGMNGGWVQIMGPVSRIAQFKQIETTFGNGQIQQLRWPPANIADTPAAALSRLFMLPGSHYSDPEFSWKWEVAPAALGFVDGQGLGPQYDSDMILGAATANLEGGHLFRFNLTGNRLNVGVDDPRLDDHVADNLAKNDLTESESLLFGIDFGIVTDLETGPNGNLFVVSLGTGSIYEIVRTRPCLDAPPAGPLTVPAGRTLCIGGGEAITGPVTVRSGGSLEIEGGTITGPVTATGAASVRICGATLTGPLTVSGSTGLVLIGGHSATGACAANMLVGAVTLTGNTAGVEFSGNRVVGPLRITGNTGTLPPPDTGPVHAVGNTVTGPATIQP